MIKLSEYEAYTYRITLLWVDLTFGHCYLPCKYNVYLSVKVSL